MDGQAIVTVSAAVVALTQILKWANVVPDKWGPLAVLVLSAIGVAVWGFTRGEVLRSELFDYFAGWIAIATSAAGVFGFSRATAATLTKAIPPPGGAGQERTTN